MKPEVGLHTDVDEVTYRAWDACNFSLAKYMKKSPMHCSWERKHPTTPKEAYEIGRAVHMAVLEPDRFPIEYVRGVKCDRRTKVGKADWAAFEAANVGKEILRDPDFTLCTAIRDSVWKSPWSADLLGGSGSNELPFAWIDEDTGVLCKGKVDRVAVGSEWTSVIDLKTTRNAAAESFSKDIANFDYCTQAAFYLDGLNTISNHKRRFLWIAVEKEPPFATALYEAHPDSLELGRWRYKSWLHKWKECEESGHWPSYSETVTMLDVPRWAYAQAERGEP